MLIVDLDPIKCAQYTPASLYKYILEATSIAFARVNGTRATKNRVILTNDSPLQDLVVNDIYYSKRNRDWLTTYHNAVAMAYSRKFTDNYCSVKCDYIPRNAMAAYFSAPLKLHSPACDPLYADLVKQHNDTYKLITDVVELSRLMLIHMEPSPDEFISGEPEWLKENNYEDFITFDPINKLHIKISKGPRGYRYFVAHISDNWIEIEGVPKGIDLIVAHLINNQI